MSPRLRARLRAAVPTFLLAAVVYVPLLLTRRGHVGADTKTYLYLDPGRLLSRATSMWDPGIGLGTVTHQNIGYLWPIGPYYWLMDTIGLPDWFAQRIWTASIMFFAGLGVRFMLKAMGQEGPHVTAATFCYALTPYVLTLGARLSVILLPYAGLPWLVGLTVLALQRRRWREPALFALVVATIGSINATALILVGTAPILWILHEVVITREVKFGDAMAVVGRIGLLTTACSLWWLSGLWAQGGYGINILRYTETAQTVAAASLSLEVMRGLGYWFFYGEDRFGPWIAPSRSYMRRVDLMAITYLLPGLGLVGLAVARFRERFFFAALLATGVVLSVGPHPWDDPPLGGEAIKAFLLSEYGLAMRSLPRATPLVALAMSVLTGSLLAAIAAQRPKLGRPMTAGIIVLTLAAMPSLWRLNMVDPNLDRPEEIPDYWLEAAEYLDGSDTTRVLEIPGADFASYRWGNTVDPILPGLMDRPYVARELIPYGSPAAANLLDAFDHQMQEGILDSTAIAPIARFMGVGEISVRSDLTYERYNTPRPRRLWELLRNTTGIDLARSFGPAEPNQTRPEVPMLDETELLTPVDWPDPPEVAVFEVEDAQPIVRTSGRAETVVLAGDGEGLVHASGAGLLTGNETVLYSASFADDENALRELVAENAVLVLTDTNRRAGQRWGSVRDNHGETERPGQQALRTDLKDQRLDVFPEADALGDDHRTVIDSRGAVLASATSYGNTVTLTAEDRAAHAVDGEAGTAWRTGGFSYATGETLRLDYRNRITTDNVRVLQAIGGVRTRHITEIEISFDGGEPLAFELDASSAPESVDDLLSAGQLLTFEPRTFKRLEITIVATDPGKRPRYDGLSGVGFAEVTVFDELGVRQLADDVVRLPTDLLDTFGGAANDHPLAVVMTRQRTAGSVAVRHSPESTLERTFELPAGRSFTLSGDVRLSSSALSDATIDRALGLPDATAGGVTATSSRRLPGGLTTRAMSAIDHDRDTWYSPGYLAQQGEYLDYVSATPLTFDHVELTVLNDGRHSVPRRVRFELDGRFDADLIFELPEIPDSNDVGSSYTFSLEFPRQVTASRVRFVVEESVGDPAASVRDVTTLDWYSGDEIVMPIGIVEVGIDGLLAPTMPESVDPACRGDLIEVNGEPFAVSLLGSTDDLLAGRAVDLVPCFGQTLELPAGEVTIRTADGALTGFDLDQLVLRSGPGGTADPTAGSLLGSLRGANDAMASRGNSITKADTLSPTAVDVVLGARAEPTWIVLGQSHNRGWEATLDGRDLGEPTLVNGYANGWLLPPGAAGKVQLRWMPQRVVNASLALSALAVVISLVLIVRRPSARGASAGEPDPRWIPIDLRPSMPQPFDLDRVRRYAGPTPSRFSLVATPLAAAAVALVFIGAIPAILLAMAAVLCLRIPRARVLLTFGGPVIFAGCVGWVLVNQLFREYPSGFDWPTYFEAVHQPALVAIALLALDPVIDRCWLRRWWPTQDSPT